MQDALEAVNLPPIHVHKVGVTLARSRLLPPFVGWLSLSA